MQSAAPAVLIGEDEFIACLDDASGGWNRNLEECGGGGVAGFAPIEAGVGDDEFDSGDEEGEKAECGEPVGEADDEGMARGAGNGGGAGAESGGPHGIYHPWMITKLGSVSVVL